MGSARWPSVLVGAFAGAVLAGAALVQWFTLNTMGLVQSVKHPVLGACVIAPGAASATLARYASPENDAEPFLGADGTLFIRRKAGAERFDPITHAFSLVSPRPPEGPREYVVGERETLRVVGDPTRWLAVDSNALTTQIVARPFQWNSPRAVGPTMQVDGPRNAVALADGRLALQSRVGSSPDKLFVVKKGEHDFSEVVPRPALGAYVEGMAPAGGSEVLVVGVVHDRLVASTVDMDTGITTPRALPEACSETATASPFVHLLDDGTSVVVGGGRITTEANPAAYRLIGGAFAVALAVLAGVGFGLSRRRLALLPLVLGAAVGCVVVVVAGLILLLLVLPHPTAG